MTARPQRGYALAVLLAVMTVMGTVGGVLWMQLDARAVARRHEERRMGLMWLARSATANGKRLDAEVPMGMEKAVVRTRLERTSKVMTTVSTVTVRAWGVAHVTSETAPDGTPLKWTESFERAR